MAFPSSCLKGCSKKAASSRCPKISSCQCPKQTPSDTITSQGKETSALCPANQGTHCSVSTVSHHLPYLSAITHSSSEDISSSMTDSYLGTPTFNLAGYKYWLCRSGLCSTTQGMWQEESKGRTARVGLAELSSEMYIHRVVVALNVAPCPFLPCRSMVTLISDKGRMAQCSLPSLSTEALVPTPAWVYRLCRAPLSHRVLEQHTFLTAAESPIEKLIAGTMGGLNGAEKALRSTHTHRVHTLCAVLLPTGAHTKQVWDRNVKGENS